MNSAQISSQSPYTFSVMNLSCEKSFWGLYHCHKPFKGCRKRFEKLEVDYSPDFIISARR